MLTSRIAVTDSITVEGQAGTRAALEDALEAALNVLARRGVHPPGGSLNKTLHPDVTPHKAFREPETQAEELIVRAAPQIAGPPPPKAPTGILLTPPATERPQANHQLSYEGANQIADYARIALEDLGRLYGTEQGFTTKQIREHMEATGGDVAIRDNKRPTSALRQAIKHSDYFVREVGGINWLREWVNKLEVEPQSEEPIDDLNPSGFELQKSEDGMNGF